MRPEREHYPGCPRLQFWDAGEWQAPCLCDDPAPWWRDPRFWIAVVLIGLTFVALTVWVTTPAQAQDEEPEVLCLEPRDAHNLVGQSIAMRASLVACQGELQDLGEAPECSSACSELAEWAERIEEGVSWAILPDGRAEQHPEGRYRFGTHRDWERVPALIEECRADMESGCRYVPGLPSTGRVEVELVPGEAGHE